MAEIRVLIVDDHALLRDAIRALLALHNDIEVVGEAVDGRDAIEKVRQLKPNVVLMDIVMPLMDGLEATRCIHQENPQVKVLILTQHDNCDYILSSIRAGAAGAIPKRAAASELVSAIRIASQGDSYLYPSVASMLIQDYLQQLEQDPYERLTDREREVFKLVAEGRTSQEIADLLCITLKTVLSHRTKVMEKLRMHSYTELVKYAISKALITVDT